MAKISMSERGRPTQLGSHSQALPSYPLSFFQLFHFLSPKWRLRLPLTAQSPPLNPTKTSTTPKTLPKTTTTITTGLPTKFPSPTLSLHLVMLPSPVLPPPLPPPPPTATLISLLSLLFLPPSPSSPPTSPVADPPASSPKCTSAALRPPPPPATPPPPRRPYATPFASPPMIRGLIQCFSTSSLGCVDPTITPSCSESLAIGGSGRRPFDVLNLLCGGSRDATSKVNWLVL